MNTKIDLNFRKYLKWALLSAIAGVLAGTAAAIFLITLDWATNSRLSHPVIIWGLPLAGFFVGFLYHHYGSHSGRGNNLIIDEIHDPKNVLPLRMAPLVLGGTIITHLFGGSAGREGTAVQMGATLSDQLSHFFKIEADERKILLVAGAGAGFGAAIGAPWAGVIFGMEVISIGRLKLFALLECFIASFTGYYTAVFLGAPHSHYPKIDIADFELKTFFFVALAGIIFGLTAKIFSMTVHFVEKINAKFIFYPPLKPFIGGLILIFLYNFEGSYRYAGLGIPTIQEALTITSDFKLPILKTSFTALTVGSGFKGGEFIPLVFIGTTLGSALSIILPVSFKLLAALGFAAVFAGASNTPIACSIMAMEIFGIQVGLYSVIACFMSYYFSGHHGIYKAQRIHSRKQEQLKERLLWFGELPKRFFNGEKK